MNWQTLNYIFWTVISLLGIVGFVNAVFSLRDRWKKWRALKSQKNFETRIDELEKRIKKTIHYKEIPLDFLLDSIEFSIFPLICLIGAFILFIVAISSYFSIPSFTPIADTLIQLAIFLLLIPIFFLLEMRERIVYFQNPDLLLVEIAKLISVGNDKKFSINKHLDLVDFMIENNLLTQQTRDVFITAKQNAIDKNKNESINDA